MQASECHCPLCLDFIFDPVTAECGQHNFCKSCYRKLFNQPSPWKCPCCRERLTDRNLGTNLLLATLLQAHFPVAYADARRRHLPAAVDLTEDETTDDDQPPLGNANDPGVAAAAEELFQAAPESRPNVILQNRRRRPRDSDSSDEELNALRRDYPSYSRTALRQLRAAIQRNQRRRLA